MRSITVYSFNFECYKFCFSLQLCWGLIALIKICAFKHSNYIFMLYRYVLEGLFWRYQWEWENGEKIPVIQYGIDLLEFMHDFTICISLSPSRRGLQG